MNIPWWGYVVGAGLAWGTYVPLVFFGGTELTKPGTIGGRLASILCVGVAYFVLAVVVPVVLMATRDDAQPEWKTNGLVFSALAGVAGAVGAICVIFASKAAVDTAKTELAARETAIVERIKTEPDPATRAGLEEDLGKFRADRPHQIAKYRIYIAPLIFSLAPLINTILSLVWHPRTGNPWVFHFDVPGWKLPVGILLVAAGTFLVLFSKEETETGKPKPPPTVAPSPAPGGS